MHGGRVEARSDGLGHGQRVRRRAAASCDAARAAASDGGADEAVPARGGSWSWTTTATPPTRSAQLLTALGADVSVVAQRRAALDALEAFEPDAVLLDIGMPDMDGYEVARRIRASTGSAVLLIALTGWGQEHDHRRSQAAGFDHHVVKPPDIDRLRELFVTLPRMRPAKSTTAALRRSPAPIYFASVSGWLLRRVSACLGASGVLGLALLPPEHVHLAADHDHICAPRSSTGTSSRITPSACQTHVENPDNDPPI